MKNNINLQHENFISSAPTKNSDKEKKTSKYFYHSPSPPFYFQNPIVLNLAENSAVNSVKTQYGRLSILWYVTDAMDTLYSKSAKRFQ